MLIERDCFELAEIIEEWGLSDADIRYLVGKGALTLSALFVDQPASASVCEEIEAGRREWLPVGSERFHGVADLSVRDAFRLVRDGERTVSDVFAPDGRRLRLRAGDGLRLERRDVLVRRTHWEAVHAQALASDAANPMSAFDFRQFVYNEFSYAFTLPQARALAFLFESARAGASDQHHLKILEAAGASSTKLGNLFSRKPYWKRIVLKTPGRRGWYYLDPAFVVWLRRSG